MNIDPRHLYNLLAVEEHGTFSKAAAARGISQPALSNSIAALERQIGATVIDRTRRGGSVNALGHILTRRARELRALLYNTAEELRYTMLGGQGPLTIGMTPSMAPSLVSGALILLLNEFPDALVTVVAELDDKLVPGLRDGTFDFLLGPLPMLATEIPDIVEDPLLEDSFIVLVGKSSPLARRRSIALEELQDLTWVLPQPASPYYDQLAALFKACGLPWPKRHIRTNSPQMIEALVANMDAVALGSRLAVIGNPAIRTVPLRGAHARKVGLRYRRGSQIPPIGARLIEHLRAIASNWQMSQK